MTVDVESPRYAVEHRRRPRGKWVTLSVHPSADAALRAMYDSMGRDRRGGDWRVSPVPCMAAPPPGSLPSGMGPPEAGHAAAAPRSSRVD
jgi:hypothetical protein